MTCVGAGLVAHHLLYVYSEYLSFVHDDIRKKRCKNTK